MIDGFVILTPILILASIALLGFVGCQSLFSVSPGVTAVEHVQTIVTAEPAGTDTITAGLSPLSGGELIVVTLQWRSASVQQPTPAVTLNGTSLAGIAGGGPFDWNTMQVQSFFGFNAPGSTSAAVQALVAGSSNLQWNLCVSAYNNVDRNNPTFGPQQSDPGFIGTILTAPPISTGTGDTVYAVAFAANNTGTFPGNNSLSAGPNFTTEFPSITNPLVESGGIGSPIAATATNTAATPNPRGFILAIGIQVASSS
jgi:hypothetical protein